MQPDQSLLLISLFPFPHGLSSTFHVKNLIDLVFLVNPVELYSVFVLWIS